MKGINFVKQLHTYGCGVACLAMATHRTYEEVLEILPKSVFDVSKEGICMDCISSMLREFDMVTELRYKTVMHTQKKRENFMTPFAPLHIVQINKHFVFMIEWHVYDPNKEFTESYDYTEIKEEDVVSILGIWDKPPKDITRE